jgi:hypothetical protein
MGFRQGEHSIMRCGTSAKILNLFGYLDGKDYKGRFSFSKWIYMLTIWTIEGGAGGFGFQRPTIMLINSNALIKWSLRGQRRGNPMSCFTVGNDTTDVKFIGVHYSNSSRFLPSFRAQMRFLNHGPLIFGFPTSWGTNLLKR